ncbi:MAG TPA: type II secretion system F family protein [Verrucomicrobiae bacterium]|jgi:general secretion pathway protein F
MNSFRYQAVGSGGAAVQGVIEASDRRAALHLLGSQGLFPSNLELCDAAFKPAPITQTAAAPAAAAKWEFRLGSGVKKKEVTALTRQMSALLNAGIPILQSLGNLGEEEANLALRKVLMGIAEAVRKGSSLSAAMAEHPALFGNLYVSMVRVGEEAGALPKVMNDLAALLEHEDELRGEVASAVAYPVFVLCFGFVTVAVLLTVVMPKLFSMLTEMSQSLPLPTIILLRASAFVQAYWIALLIGLIAAALGLRWYLRTPRGRENWDDFKLKLPVLGGVYRGAALSRFARTLGTLARSGVSLLPSLKIVENTIGNLTLAKMIAQVAEETRGGNSLAAPLRKLGVFSKSVVQMISVGEESGMLADMLLKVADIEERAMRARTKTMISLLAPALILVVGAMVGFMVIAILLPIFSMSQALQR